jgi:enoyl-CoA hydratase/carnithine racemase
MPANDGPGPLERDSGVVLSTIVGSTLVVTLNRPDVANALNAELMEALHDLWRRAARDRRLRAVILTGAGASFCSGADAAMLSKDRPRVGETAAEELAFVPGPHLGVPVLAAVNGACAGGGLHFVADADICLAGRSARFLDPHVSVGQVAALEPLLLRLRMRPDRLARMVLLGRHEVLSATQAELSGLISEVVPDEELLPRALALADLIARSSPEAVRLSRRILRDLESRLLGAEPDLGWEIIKRHRHHPDAIEGPAAFLERREPRWEERS